MSVASDAAVTKEVSREKNMDLKSMQINASNSVTRMTKRAVNIPTDYTGRKCLDVLST